MKPHLIMPMGGKGSRFTQNGYVMPKPLIDINGKPFLYWAAKSVTKFVDTEDITFVVLQQHIYEFAIDKVILYSFPQAKIITLPDVLPGPVFTCLEGIKNINDDGALLFNDCDHMFKCGEINALLNNNELDSSGALLTFKSDESQFSYVRYDVDGNITGTVEKQVVSDHAICGAYIFKNAGLFRNIADEYIKECPYSECFLSGMYNVMCKKGMKVKDYLLDFHVEFGTPEEYENAKGSDYFNCL